MSKKLIFNKSGGNNLSIDEESITANVWVGGIGTNYSDFGIYTPVFDSISKQLYFNHTGVFIDTRPGADSANWELLASSSGGHISDIKKLEDGSGNFTGVVEVTFADTTPKLDFEAGHVLQNTTGNDPSIYRKNLKLKGDTVFENSTTDTTVVELDLSQIDTNETNADASKIVTDKITLGGSATVSGDDVGIDLDDISINKTNADASKIVTDKITLGASATVSGDDTGIDLDQISINKTNADASKIKTDFLDPLTSATNLDDIRAQSLFITLDEPINLNIINDQIDAIIKALGNSDQGFTSAVFSIPDAIRSWTTDNFTRNNVNISSTGVVSRVSATSWVYDVAGELYIPPPLAYHIQDAIIDGNTFKYVTIGISLSVERHAGYIESLVAIKDYIPMGMTGFDSTVPNPKNIFFENYQGHQFTATENHSEASTDGITVFEYTPSDVRQRLFTITLPILVSVQDHYDNQNRFEIQTDRGLNAFYHHEGSDNVITAGLKAAITANAAAIKDNTAHIDRYPDITAIQTAPQGQVLSKTTENVAGTVSSMSFRVTSVNSVGTDDSLLLVIQYPNHSPLDNFAQIVVPVTIVTDDTVELVAAKLQASFESGTNASLMKFRTGYIGSDGVTYGGYEATVSGDVVTIVSKEQGSVYNAGVGLYEAVERFDSILLNAFEHGSGGPRSVVEFEDFSGGVSWIGSAAAYNLRTWKAGDLMIPSVNFTVDGTTIPGTSAVLRIHFDADPINSNQNTLTVFNNPAFNLFFDVTNTPVPALPVSAWIVGWESSTNLLNTDWGFRNNGQIWFPGGDTSTVAARDTATWLGEMAGYINSINQEGEGGTASTNNGDSVTTPVELERLGTATVEITGPGHDLVLTLDTAGLTSTTVTDVFSRRNNTDVTGAGNFSFTNGTAAVTPSQPYLENRIYIRNADAQLGWVLLPDLGTYAPIPDPPVL